MDVVRDQKGHETTHGEKAMMGYGFGMGAGGWIAMTIFWVALIVLVVWLLRNMFSVSNGRSEDRGWQETPEQTLDRRYAAGEIDDETYHSMRANLRSSGSSRRADR
jgi:putative membrane protein